MPRLLEGLHVVLVEDNADTRNVMNLVMGYQGALVVDATDAKIALELLAKMKPNVLVLDINMPDHDGIWLVREARQLGYLEDVPTLAVSALDPASEHVRGAGFDAYLRKPVEPDELCLTVHRIARPPRA